MRTLTHPAAIEFSLVLLAAAVIAGMDQIWRLLG